MTVAAPYPAAPTAKAAGPGGVSVLLPVPEPRTQAPPTAALRRTAAAVLTGSVAVTAAAAVAVGRFAVPAYDDFMRATRRGGTAADLGWWGYVFGFTYRRWQGRWASCGLESAVLPHVDMVRWYPLLLTALAFVNGAGAYIVCRWLTRDGPRRRSAAVTAVGLALLWAGMPSVAEAVYWFVGTVENTLPLAAGSALVVALAWDGRRLPRTAVGGLSAAAVAVVGLHEMYGAMLCIALAVGTSAAVRARSPRRAAWATVTAAAVVGLVVVVAAPGNRVRLAQEGRPTARHLGFVLRLAADEWWNNGRSWLFDPKLVAATVWVAFSPTLEAARRPWPSARRVDWRWVIPATWAALLAVGFALPSWAFGTAAPPRTLSGDYVVFVAGWLLSVYVWTRPLAVPPPAAADAWRPLRSPAAADAAALLLAGSLLAVGSVRSAAEDVAHRLRPWHAAVEARFDLLRRSAGRDAVVHRLPPPPYLLLGGDVVNDPSDYRNRGPVAYFGLAHLTLVPPPAASSTVAAHPFD